MASGSKLFCGQIQRGTRMAAVAPTIRVAVNGTTNYRIGGRPILFRKRVFNPRTNRHIEGYPVLVFHPDGLPCCGPGGRTFLNF